MAADLHICSPLFVLTYPQRIEANSAGFAVRAFGHNFERNRSCPSSAIRRTSLSSPLLPETAADQRLSPARMAIPC